MKRFLIFIITILFASAAASCSGSKLTLNGDIQNNIISANSTVSGKIIKLNKQQGETVKKGEIIAVIDNTNQKYAVDQLKAMLEMKKAKLEELQAGTRPEQIEQAQAQVRAAKAQLELLQSGSRDEQIAQAENNVSIAQETISNSQSSYDYISTQYNNAQVLYNNGYMSKLDLDSSKNKLDSAASQLATAKYQLANAKQQLNLLKNGSTTESINAAKANYDAANAQLKLLQNGSTKQTLAAAKADMDQTAAQLNQAQYNLDSCNITALADGIIISKNFELGDIVNVGSNIADIAISNDVYVLCYIPEKYLGKIYYNQPLSVTTDLGTQTGKLSYIALKSEYTPKDKQSTSDGGSAAVKIKVSINDEGGKLKSGMTAKVTVPLK